MTTIHLPKTNPGGMDAWIAKSRVPGCFDKVMVGPIAIPMDEFCRLMELALSESAMSAEDPRVRVLSRLNAAPVYDGDGRIQLEPPAPTETSAASVA